MQLTFKFLWITYYTIYTIEEPPLTYGQQSAGTLFEDKTEQKTDKGQ
jgi:hypothetical protein